MDDSELRPFFECVRVQHSPSTDTFYYSLEVIRSSSSHSFSASEQKAHLTPGTLKPFLRSHRALLGALYFNVSCLRLNRSLYTCGQQ